MANFHLVQVAFAGRRLVCADAPDDEIAQLSRSRWQSLWIGAVAFAAGMVSPLAGLAALTVGTPIIGWIVARPRRGGTADVS